MVQRPPAGTIPDAPGSYQFKDRDGRVIYVGKAHSLRSRLSNYFVPPASLPPRTASMVNAAETVEWIQVRNDVEALMLEYSLIKAHQPRFNIRLKDDKSYPFLAVTLDQEWPRPMVMRGRKRKGVRYFGPYGHAYAIRETLDLLLRTFPLRTCSDNKFDHHQRLGRPCLLFHIEKCSGPCVGEVTPEEYARHTQELLDFLDGDTDDVVRRLRTQMQTAAGELEFEQAARLRDRLTSVQKAIEKQQMVAERSEDFDVIGLAEDELEAAVQVFFVRKGRVTGRKGFVLDKVEDVTPGGLLGTILEGLYDDPPLGVPKTVLVPTDVEDTPLYEEWLSSLRGSKVAIRVPQRGDKRELQATVERNALEEFVRHRLRRASDHNSRAKALNELQDHLGLPVAPLRIECYDMSHIQGTDYVGSMVVLEDGLPKKSEYRRFKIKGVPGNDDFAAMEEVLTRRLTAYLAERRQPSGDRPGKFAYPPQLLLVDGGKGQLGVAVKVLEELGLAEEIPVAALAKRFEEVYLPGEADPCRLPRQSDALYLLQRIRDEAHRFAITYHRQLRGKRMTKSVLDDIPGLGEVRRKRLVKELGGVNAVKHATLDELHALPWLPNPVAEAVHRKIHGMAPPVTDDLWEQHSAWWQDGFTEGADPEYEEQILPLIREHLGGAQQVLDVGCGEGQVARLALAGGATTAVGVDPTWTQLTVAADRGGGATYARAGAAALPFATGTFDAAVACLVFEHITDVDAAIAELGRVLRPGGRFLFLLNHPLLQTPNSGWIDDQVLDPPEQYWRIGPYLVEDETMEEVEKGVFIPFVHRPLSRYLNALADAGLTLRRMEEPAPPPGFLARAAEYAAAAPSPASSSSC